MGKLFERRKTCPWLAVVQDQAASAGLTGNECDGIAEGLKREVRNDSKPGEERRRVGVEAGVVQLFNQRLAFKIYWSVGDVIGNRDAVTLQQIALPFLRGRMIALENPELWVRISVSEGVKTGSQQDVLADTLFDSVAQIVFRKPAAGHNECA